MDGRMVRARRAPGEPLAVVHDGVMMASKEFADGLGIDVHIRTTRVDNPRMSYSYISGTAVKIGTDIHILEVQDDGSMFHVPSL